MHEEASLAVLPYLVPQWRIPGPMGGEPSVAHSSRFARSLVDKGYGGSQPAHVDGLPLCDGDAYLPTFLRACVTIDHIGIPARGRR